MSVYSPTVTITISLESSRCVHVGTLYAHTVFILRALICDHFTARVVIL